MKVWWKYVLELFIISFFTTSWLFLTIISDNIKSMQPAAKCHNTDRRINQLKTVNFSQFLSSLTSLSLNVFDISWAKRSVSVGCSPDLNVRLTSHQTEALTTNRDDLDAGQARRPISWSSSERSPPSKRRHTLKAVSEHTRLTELPNKS